MNWERVCSLEDLAMGGTLYVSVGGEGVCLYRLPLAIYATQDQCSHGIGRLSEGYVLDGLIECPLHQGLFDIATGAPAGGPCTVALRTYPVKVVDGAVFVQV